MRIHTDSKTLGLPEVKPSVAQDSSTPSEDHTAAVDSFEKDALARADYAYATTGSRTYLKGEYVIEILPSANLTTSWWSDLTLLIDQLPESPQIPANALRISEDTLEAMRVMFALAPHRNIRV